MALSSPPAEARREPLRLTDRRTLFLVGHPNVGKSVLFNALTGSYAIVSNYPGTTVEVSRGTSEIGGSRWDVIDTPGMYSLTPITDKERVARDILLKEEGPIVHVVDAKNLPRMLPLTLELALMNRPMVLVLNLMDEAERAGVSIDTSLLARALGMPVIEMVATKGLGLKIKGALEDVEPPSPPHVPFARRLEDAMGILRAHLPENSWRFWALHHLEADPVARDVAPVPPAAVQEAMSCLGGGSYRRSLPVLASTAFHEATKAALQKAYADARTRRVPVSQRLDRLLLNPWTGFPILGLVVYVGLYQFVGVFGGGTVVNWLENTVFGQWINPFLERLFGAMIPWMWLRTLFVGEYGLLTLGVRYATAIILPIVGTFFLAFSVLEDTGYLPRLSMMLDRLFKTIGLNGRAVIPLVLGLGCDTMATMVTRILETKRERLIATFLLALTIPCSAQIGVILALLAGHPKALVLWAGVMMGIFLVAGTLAARVVPGEKPTFFMELPPLRLPSIKNVWSKTVSRMGWYFLEVFPLFLLASVLIWIGQVTGIFPKLVAAVVPLVKFLGLPADAAVAFLFGFFRRDYGAAGLYDLQKSGALNGVQLLVATVTLTIFLPCIAQFLIMRKERGWGVTLAMSGIILATAFSVGWLLKTVLLFSGVTL